MLIELVKTSAVFLPYLCNTLNWIYSICQTTVRCTRWKTRPRHNKVRKLKKHINSRVHVNMPCLNNVTMSATGQKERTNRAESNSSSLWKHTHIHTHVICIPWDGCCSSGLWMQRQTNTQTQFSYTQLLTRSPSCMCDWFWFACCPSVIRQSQDSEPMRRQLPTQNHGDHQLPSRTLGKHAGCQTHLHNGAKIKNLVQAKGQFLSIFIKNYRYLDFKCNWQIILKEKQTAFFSLIILCRV